MNCDELRDLYELYALGVLEDEERQEIDAHMARNCPNCTAGVKRALALNAAITSFAPSDAEPPREMRDRILASVGAKQKRQFSWWPAWALVSASLAIAAFYFNLDKTEAQRSLAEARRTINVQSLEIEKSRAILDFLDKPETRQVGFDGKTTRPPRGNFFVNPKAGVLMIAQNLPALTGGKTYQMWVIPKGQDPKPAGIFQPDASGSATHLLTGNIDLATLGAVAVSVEPEGGSQKPTEVIIVAPVGL